MYKKARQVTCPPEFRNRCPIGWETLTNLPDTEDRWCSICKKQVHRTDDPEKLEQLAKEGECVAVLYDQQMLLGSISFDYNAPAKGFLSDKPFI